MNKKRFGTVEILIILVILSIILIVAIPWIINGTVSFRKQLFIDYSNVCVEKVYKAYDDSGRKGSIYSYNINRDIGINESDEFEGYIVIDSRDKENPKYYLYIHNKDYQLVKYDITNNKTINKNDITSYDKDNWMNITNTYQACRDVESDVSVNCYNKEGYIIAQ